MTHAICKISKSLWMPHGNVARYEHSREHENERKLLRNEGAGCQRACHLCFSTAVLYMKRMKPPLRSRCVGRPTATLEKRSPINNTELIYSNELAHHIAARGQHKAIICEGVDRLLGFRSPNYIYVPPASETDSGPIEDRRVKLLLKNYRLSDDIAFRFSNRA